jgi:hypothetical protein
MLLLEALLGTDKVCLVRGGHLLDLLPLFLEHVVAILSLMRRLLELCNTHFGLTSLIFEEVRALFSFESFPLGRSSTLMSLVSLANGLLLDTLGFLSEVLHVFLQARKLGVEDFLVAVGGS